MDHQIVNVTIENDDLLEIDEIFIASLALENPDTDSRVQLRPVLAIITILDEDGECITKNNYIQESSHSFIIMYAEAVIGFVPDNYTVTEGADQFANLYVGLIAGQLGCDVLVNFDTQDGSAGYQSRNQQ